jgi:hypothetical protein
VSFLDIRAPKAQLEEIRGKLQEIVQSVTGIAEAEEDGEGAPEPARYRLTLAYYPLDSPRTPEPSPRRKR